MPLDWDDGTLSGYLLNLTFPCLRLGTITSITRYFLPGRRAGGFFYIERALPQNLRFNIFDLFSTMKTRSSTPSHYTAAATKANPTPQPRSTTPSLNSAAGLKQAQPPPTNPYRTLTRSTSPPQGESTSPTLLSVTGVDDNDHRPLPHRRRTKARRNEARFCVMTGIWNYWWLRAQRDDGLRRSHKPSQATLSIWLRLSEEAR